MCSAARSRLDRTVPSRGPRLTPPRRFDIIRDLVTDGDFSLVRGDWPFRMQRAVGLIPADGLGIGRRIVFLVLLTWLPVAGWALVTARALPGHVNEPLFEHFGVHARCLVAIPLFLVTEATLHGMSHQLVPYFVSSGLVAVEDRQRFRCSWRGSQPCAMPTSRGSSFPRCFPWSPSRRSVSP
jgi:hypothetical protein